MKAFKKVPLCMMLVVVVCQARQALATPHAYVGSFAGSGLAGYGIAISSDGANVYAATSIGKIGIFNVDPTTGAVSAGGVALSSGGTYDVVVSADGKHVYAALQASGVRIFDRDLLTGLLTDAGSIGSFSAWALALSPDDKHLYVCDTGGNSLVAYSRDTATGALTFIEGKTDGVGGVDGLELPVDVTVSPDGASVYVAARTGNAVSVFSRDAVTGALTFVEVQRDGVGGVIGLGFVEGGRCQPRWRARVCGRLCAWGQLRGHTRGRGL